MSEKYVHKTDNVELRSRAEERLGADGVIAYPPISVEDQLRLLHELQVHQIELEMQNAELLQARDDETAALEKYTDLYDFAPVGYLTLDRNGNIRAANLTGAGLMGIERSRLIGRSFGRFVSGKARSAFDGFLEKVFTSLARETSQVPLLKAGNSDLYVQLEGIAAASGDECRIVMFDISERKQAEEVLRLMNETAEMLHQANEAAETLHLANQAAEALRLANESTGALLLAEEAAEALRLTNEATGALRLAKEATEALLMAKEAAVALRLTNEATEALRLTKEAAVALRLAKEAAEALRLAKESAEETARKKSLFFANMSHELRTPMTGILGMLQLALVEDLAPTTREYLETTLSSARSLLQILNDILDMSKIEAGKLTIEEKPFSLQECLTDTVDIITPEVRRKGLDFAISVAQEIPETVVGDHARLRQILLNLIGNAVKFTESGKVEVRVTAGRKTSDGRREYIFAVSDTGIGIPDDKGELLFHTFSQVDSSHSRIYGGTGLGLAICREIVELMGGAISFESEEGVGSTFSFTIPFGKVKFETSPPTAAISRSPEKITVPEEKKILRLLIAEDEPNTRKVLGSFLKLMTNFKFDFAEDGRKAVEMWEKGDYDLILMDVQMPRLDGFKAARTIREKELERGGRSPIIAMTAHTNKEDKKRCLAAGMDAFISKPIDFMECLQLIEQIITQNSSGFN